MIASQVLSVLARGINFGFGRIGKWILTPAMLLAMLGYNTFLDTQVICHYWHGRVNSRSISAYTAQWDITVIGLDMLKQGSKPFYYFIVTKPGQYIRHPIICFFARYYDGCDALEISPYLPFPEDRDVICYVFPDSIDQKDILLEAYPDAEVSEIKNNLERTVATRITVRAKEQPKQP